jgi:flagellar protein FliS
MQAYGALVQRYHRTEVETSDPLRLVLLAYDGLLSSLRKALEHQVAGEFEAKAREVQRALDLINELWSSLDMERGGPIARNLAAIYGYASKEILLADARKDAAAMEAVHGLLHSLREAWAMVKRSSAAPVVSPDPPGRPVGAEAVGI